MSSFYGLIMKPYCKYTQQVTKAFHISSVAIDEGEYAKLYMTIKNEKYVVATLSHGTPQTALDLNFSKGERVVLESMGNATICLLGYSYPTDGSDDDESILISSDGEVTASDVESRHGKYRPADEAHTNFPCDELQRTIQENYFDHDMEDDLRSDDYSASDAHFKSEDDMPLESQKSKEPILSEAKKLVQKVIVAVLNKENENIVKLGGKRRNTWPIDGAFANREDTPDIKSETSDDESK
ncbi:39 kDa FK506-binding nuclear protein [Drosophila virilis]|uniref:Nucleoplasmin-like domain-containing protein n=1 Tax=Drosophila virilis TaxID=7244 RepID=B4M2Z2_DROVI|nr:39 kDa FK506-binding nuclear protein [Drosophila virilis]EDW65167.1 uncharacterized protein Dvir_GJ19050 [Drosophila virilis]